MKSIEIAEIMVDALPGAIINDCRWEAVLLACKEQRNVRLKFNGEYYSVQWRDLINCMKKETVGGKKLK